MRRTASTNFRDRRNFNPRIPYGMRLATIKHTSSFRVLLQFFLSNFCTVFPQYGAAGFHQELHHMTAQTKTGTSPPCLYIPETQPKTNPPAATGGAREGKDDGDTDAQTARYQETGPSGSVRVGDREEAGRGPRHGREIRRHGRHDAETAHGQAPRLQRSTRTRRWSTDGSRPTAGRHASSATPPNACTTGSARRPSTTASTRRRRST